MARARGCRSCFVEMDAIVLADGGTVFLCSQCDSIADARHLDGGRRGWAAGMGRKDLKLVVSRPKSWSVKKISYTGKKSLTA
jgi:hypothetical protein